MKFSEDNGISAQAASRLFIFIGLASSLARIITGKLCNNKKVNSIFTYQASMLLAALSVFLLQFAATKYWLLIVFSFIYGFSDGIFMTSAVYTQLTCVDAKRVTASFCTSNVLYSIAAAAGSPIAGELISIMSQFGLYVLFSQLRSCDHCVLKGICHLSFHKSCIIILVDEMKFKTNWESGGNITWFEKGSEAYEKVYH